MPVKGPVIRPNVWTWEVPVYFWFGGIAALLIMDLGRPERFLNMFRIFKLRSPMSTGAWCLGRSRPAAAARWPLICWGGAPRRTH